MCEDMRSLVKEMMSELGLTQVALRDLLARDGTVVTQGQLSQALNGKGSSKLNNIVAESMRLMTALMLKREEDMDVAKSLLRR